MVVYSHESREIRRCVRPAGCLEVGFVMTLLHGSVPDGPVGQRELAKLDRKQRIADAAARLLLEFSFDEITTKAVAAAANIGEATLFRYINSKEELLTIVYGDQLDSVLNRIEQDDAVVATRGPAGGASSAAFYFSRILHSYQLRCDFYLLNPVNAALYLREGFNPGSSESARHLAQGDRTIRLTTHVLREGQSNGAIIESVDPGIVAQNCHGTYIHEIDRTPVRNFDPASIWERLEPRLCAQLVPLAIRT